MPGRSDAETDQQREVERLKAELRDAVEERDRLRADGPRLVEAEVEPQEQIPPSRGFLREHPVRAAVGLAVLLALLAGAYVFWRYTQTYERTDDAQIDGHVNAISSRVAGTVMAVHVTENQQVKQGDLLVELDPRDFSVALQRADANMAQAQAQIRAEVPSVPITATQTETGIATTEAGVANAVAGVAAARGELEAQRARVVQAEANNARAQADLERYSMLVAKDEVSRQEYDQRLAAARSAAAMLESERAAAQAAERVVQQREAALLQAKSQASQARQNAPRQVQAQRATLDLRRASAEAARAALEEAKLNLSYTRILSPVDGLVGRRAVEPGQRVQPGQQLLAIVPLQDIWVTADFKETQLRHMRPGQRAVIHVDAFERDYDGYVESMPPATSARFSILPPENASGNYVKVVQRLPVRLRFQEGQDPEHRLRPGMSVVPKVWVK